MLQNLTQNLSAATDTMPSSKRSWGLLSPSAAKWSDKHFVWKHPDLFHSNSVWLNYHCHTCGCFSSAAAFIVCYLVSFNRVSQGLKPTPTFLGKLYPVLLWHWPFMGFSMLNLLMFMKFIRFFSSLIAQTLYQMLLEFGLFIVITLFCFCNPVLLSFPLSLTFLGSYVPPTHLELYALCLAMNFYKLLQNASFKEVIT